MRIAFVAFSGIPSNSAQSINVMRGCSALAELGHEVVLLVPALHSEIIGVLDVFSFYDVPENFRIEYLTSPRFRGGRTLFNWLVAWYVHKHRVDLVFSRYLRSAILCARLGFNVIYDMHSPVKGKGADLSALARTGHLRLMVTNTELMRQNIIGHQLPGLDPDIVFPVATGRNSLRSVASPRQLPQHTSGLNLGFVGKLQVQKGMTLVAEMAARMPGHDFHILGGESKQIDEWRLKMPGAHVHFHGYVPQRDVGSYLSAIDVCLLPNTPHHENPDGVLYSSPMKALDYMAYGKAILASDMVEIREIVGDGEAAVLLPHNDPDAWVAAVEALTPERINQLGRAAATRLESEHTMRARYAKILAKAGF